MSSGTVLNEALSALAVFLRSNVSDLTVLEEWPYANQVLSYPSLTITSTQGKRTPIVPYQVAIATKGASQVTVNMAVAEWDDVFQLDLWCSDKGQRKTYQDLVIAAFNSQQMALSAFDSPDGLSLSLTNHFAETCRYEITTVKPMDGERAAQEQERRTMFQILVNCREIRQRVLYSIKTITVYEGVTAKPITDDSSNTDAIIVS